MQYTQGISHCQLKVNNLFQTFFDEIKTRFLGYSNFSKPERNIKINFL